MKFVDLALESFSVDQETRTITGIAVPYGSKQGNGYRFEKGALQYSDPSKIRLNVAHDPGAIVGAATSIKDTNSGLIISFSVAPTARGDEALTLASKGLLDGLSIEAEFDDHRDTVADPRNKTGLLVKRADLKGVALTHNPAFEDARITRVSMSEENTVTDTETTATEPVEAVAPVPTQFTDEERTALLSLITPKTEERPVVNPIRPTAMAAVTEPSPYRFNRQGTLTKGTHSLSEDLFAWDKMRDIAAYERVLRFMQAQFVDDPILTGDVNELNPTINQNRYIDERAYTYPLWSRLGRGAPPNGVQPFSYPAFSSSNIAVATHVEGTDPDAKDYVSTIQTVTPVAKSAKYQMSRELWDMGGTPNLDGLIWAKVQRAYYEHIEAVIDAALDAVTPTSLGTFTAGGGTDKRTLAAEMEQYLAALHFIRGGFRFDFVAAQADLYAHLAQAKDSSGRALYPMIAPMNANGGVASRFSTVTVGGVDFVPSWAAAAAGQTAAASSYLIDSTAVEAWATPPQRLDLTHTVSFIEIGVFGYAAAAVNDINGVREVIYDPAP